MASLVKLQEQVEEITKEFFYRNSLTEENRTKEHTAAVKIQSLFRGCKVRAHIRNLNRMALVIQKCWRGYLGRKYFRNLVKTAYYIMKMNFYNEMAVRIQRRWRGYYVRKYVHNYYALKRYLEGLIIKNEIVRKELEKFAVMKEREKEKKKLEKEERRKDYQARKMHYLLSTEQIPGVFNSPYRLFPDEMEFRLQKARPLSNSASRMRKDINEGIVDVSVSGTSFTFPPIQPLPPIGKKKPQGPFRDTTEVLQQRYKPLEPTLRVATSITSLEEARAELKREEWRNRVNDKIFLPFSASHKNRKYEALLHSTSEYGRIPHGTQWFREEDPKKWLSDKKFQTVFPSIHLFDNYDCTYSKTGQVL
ncbi:spermatogenesis-associated protein 17 [Latimeria chalumnae]|uniref:Spermatosis associated 17 n=1 Tax=Latimeria chalumnae TaxID=7897 RepID=M3XLH6_LATCH|nr:PREDICTED: spermatogenesis-associated protein 17 [Latimeria chalumnae]|eukprot:XP_005999002.1 PREDICTED: spermatogenesis-associated protein 17 [Latimeria chalumnae]